jgi:hypothetical protein
MSLDSSKSDAPPSRTISDSDIETPRGGFMARPGLKAPPRHAVVVRCGEAPEPEEIPIARSSFLPPPPVEAAPESLSEKVTLRAIPTPRAPELAVATAAHSATQMALPPVLESAPPPSDAPVVASVLERLSPVPRSRHAQRSRLTILAAALAGLVLGIVSVVTTVRVRDAAPAAPAAALPAGVEIAQATQGELRGSKPEPKARSAASASASPEAKSLTRAAPPAAAAPRSAAAKRSIF